MYRKQQYKVGYIWIISSLLKTSTHIYLDEYQIDLSCPHLHLSFKLWHTILYFISLPEYPVGILKSILQNWIISSTLLLPLHPFSNCNSYIFTFILVDNKIYTVVKVLILFFILGFLLYFISCYFQVPANLHLLVSLHSFPLIYKLNYYHSILSRSLTSCSLITINPLHIYHQHEFSPWWKLFNYPPHCLYYKRLLRMLCRTLHYPVPNYCFNFISYCYWTGTGPVQVLPQVGL